METKRVIVTGGTGFIGRHTLPHLLSCGYTVYSIGRTPIPQDLAPLCRRYPERLHHTTLDLLNTEATSKYLREVKATHLLHLAWDTRHGLFWNSQENSLWLEASRSLVNGFIKNGGVRLVGAGTCAEYEWGLEPLLEHSSPLKPSTPYGEAKLALRTFLQQPAVATAISCAWGRVFHLFGPYEDQKRLVSSACISLLCGEPFKATSGAQLRDFSSTLDVAQGFVALLDCGVTGDVNIASSEAWSVAAILQELGALAGRPELIRLGELSPPPHDPAQVLACTDRLRREVGCSFQTPVMHRLAETFEWWKIHHLRPGR